MSTRIIITNDTEPDDISIFYLDPLFLVTCERKDFDSLKSIDESQKPGIYILISPNKRYVGQASGSILTRLEQHNVKKDWWKEVVFFGRDDSHLSKSQLDYMEKSLIQKFSRLNIDLDNNTTGNDSYINRVEKIQSNKLLKQKDALINKYTDINLYKYSKKNKIKSESKPKIPQKIDVTQTKYVEILGQTFTNSSRKKILVSVITYLINNGYLNKLSKYVSKDSNPSYKYFIGKRPSVGKKGNLLTTPIKNTPYYMYSTYSTNNIIGILQEVSNLIDEDININM